MTPKPFAAFSAFLIVAALIVGFANPAYSYTECDSDSDCALGMRCELMAWETCVDVECPPGEPCPDPLPCESEEVGICVPGPCSSDADCATGLQCMAVTYEECAGRAPDPACPPGEDCGAPLPEPEPDPWDYDCETVTENFCLPPYVAPCSRDADCGTGFSCVPQEICMCSDSGSGDGDADRDMPAPPEEEPPGEGFIDEEGCVCEPTGEGFCEPDMIACSDDSVCPSGWSCEVIGAVSVPCGIDPETGEEYCDEPDPTDTESFCMPPFWDIGWGYDGEGGAIEAATGANGARVADRVLQASSGCSATPGAAGAPAALLFLLPLLVIARRLRG